MTSRRTRPWTLLLAALTVAACGGGQHFANDHRPSLPVNISAYVNDQRISVSPDSVTPGLVTITITNQSSTAEPIEVAQAGGGAITTTGPISPQATDQVTVKVNTGAYTIGVAANSSTQAASATPTGIAPGTLTVSGERPNSNHQVLQP